MQKILFFSLLLCCAAFTACKKATYLNADEASIMVPASGESRQVTLHSDANDFQLEEAPDWANVTLVDSVLVFNVSSNADGQKREGTIVVVNGSLRLELPIVQGTPATRLKPAASTLTFNYEGGTQEVNIDTDATSVTITPSEGLQAQYADGKLTVTAAPTDGSATRKGEVTLTADNLTAKVEVVIQSKVCATCGGTGRVRCTDCGGDGIVGSDNLVDGCGCERCGGVGVGGMSSIAFHMLEQGKSIAGSGKMPCPTCGGKGK